MSRGTLSRSLPLIAVLCAMAGSLAVADQSWGKEKPNAEEKIEKALTQPTSIEFVDASLQEVVSFLSGLHHIQILLDHNALDDQGLDPETPVTMCIKHVTLRSALNLMLHPLDLTYSVHDEVLEITTVDSAKERLDTKVYTVSGLVAGSAERLKALTEAVTACIAPDSWSEVGGEGNIKSLMLDHKSVLIVLQTREVHGKIEALLDQLRKDDDQ